MHILIDLLCGIKHSSIDKDVYGEAVSSTDAKHPEMSMADYT